MKLFQHYKNKPYKYLGLARHSETSEEMVIYETLYDSPSGKTWVRPKDMFFESIEIDGARTPRFKEVPLTLIETTEITEAEVSEIAKVMATAFGQWDAKWFHSKFTNHKSFHLVLALIDNHVVGFKLGYEHDAHEFYSWLGGVIPQYRGLGIASELMTRQHHWCRQKGYTKIQTKTQNRFRSMLILNLQHGFDVIGTHESDEGGLKIILEKKLS